MNILTITILSVSIAAFLLTIKSGEISKNGLLLFGTWYFTASVLLYWISNLELEIVDQMANAKLMAIKYHLASPEEYAEYMTKNVPNRLYHSICKNLIPLVLAAIGSWSIVKYLDRSVTVK